MSALTQEDLNRFGQMLDRREAQLCGEVREVQQAEQDAQDGFVGVATDLVDLAEIQRSSDLRYAETERDKIELIGIAGARERIAQGVFGDCIDCDEPIAIERLQVEPTASRCITCQERHEINHPHTVPSMPARSQTLD